MNVTLFRFILVIVGFLRSGYWLALRERTPIARAQARARILQKQSHKALRILKAKVLVEGPGLPLAKANSEGLLFIANHSSYLDTVVISAQFRCLFVSSVERKEDGLLGKIAEAAGTLFVERRKKSQLPQDIRRLHEYLQQGTALCLFPEGTTSNGREILRFKSSLLQALEGSQKMIVPLVLRYENAQGQLLDPAEMDKIAWYGEMNFLPHFLALMKREAKLCIRVRVLEPIRVDSRWTRKQIAQETELRIRQAFFQT